MNRRAFLGLLSSLALLPALPRPRPQAQPPPEPKQRVYRAIPMSAIDDNGQARTVYVRLV